MTSEDTYLTLYQVADRLQLHTMTVTKMLKSGVIRGFKAGIGTKSAWRVRQSDFDAFINDRIAAAPVVYQKQAAAA